MNGQALYTAVTTMYSNFGIDQTLFLQFVNIARANRELSRPWMRLRRLDTSKTVTPANTWLNPITLPSDFQFLTDEGALTLFDGNDTYQNIEEVPYNQVIQYKDWSNRFAVDHANSAYYILGIVDKNYTAYLFYQADYGDITLSTQWVNIPSRYHMILAFDALAMYQMGVDYDDLQARNANELARQAEILFNSMCKWDDTLQRSSSAKVDYAHTGDNRFISNKINI